MPRHLRLPAGLLTPDSHLLLGFHLIQEIAAQRERKASSTPHPSMGPPPARQDGQEHTVLPPDHARCAVLEETGAGRARAAGTAVAWNVAGAGERGGRPGHSEPRVPYHEPGGRGQPRRAPREESDRLRLCFGKSRLAACRPRAWSPEPSQGAFRTVSTRRMSLKGALWHRAGKDMCAGGKQRNSAGLPQ